MKGFDFKKIILRSAALILAAVIILCACACDGGGKGPAKPTDVPQPTEPAEAPATEEPTPDINSFDYTEKTIDADTLFDFCKTQGRTVKTLYTAKKSIGERMAIPLDYTAASIEFRAYCEGTVTASMFARSTQIGGSKLYVSVYCDGVLLGEHRADRVVKTAKDVDVVLGENLERGLHTFLIERQTEAERGTIYINSITLKGELTARPADSKYFIEVIGDSITTGYGNLWPDNADGEKSANVAGNEYVDGTKSYAVLAAKAVGADYSIVAQQGIGIVIGWQPHIMLDTYTETCYQCNRHEEWTFPRKADVVVINLGTNDIHFCNSGACKISKLEKGVRDFLKLVREKNPDAKILWAYGMMDTSFFPYIEAAVEELGGAEKGFYTLKLSPNGAGGNGHPNLKAHEDNAVTLANKLRELLGV
ncbi:MAG: hypothetical protein IKI41_05235 [Clostridia bacterium]|nr:hypothetical protein [Clostridia bacterium]